MHRTSFLHMIIVHILTFFSLVSRHIGAGLFAKLAAIGIGVALLALPGAYPFWNLEPVAALFGALIVLSLSRENTALPAEIRALAGRGLMLLPWLILGYGYAYWKVDRTLADRVPVCADAEIRRFQLEILDTPLMEVFDVPGGDTRKPKAVARFQARASLTSTEDCPGAGSYRVRMTWYEPPPIEIGDRWQVEGRLRPPWGNLNPGGFDYERWLLGQGLNGTGYVRGGIRIAAGKSGVDNRSSLRSWLAAWLAGQNLEQGSIILALMTGDDSALSRSEWRLLRDSGTIHLLVVSGLHVGMVTGFLFFIARLLVRSSGLLLLNFGARRLSGLVALAGSGVYVWLSGAGVPALRAWLMSAMLLLALSSGRAVRGSRVVILVMVVILVGEPLVVHQQGFWLSFVAVIALVTFFESGRSPEQLRPVGWRLSRGVIVFVQVQIVLLFALSPFLAEFQGGMPLQSPLVNGLVVPLIAFVVLPLILLAAVASLPLPSLAGQVLQLADGLLSLVIPGIELGAAVPAVAMGLNGTGEWCLIGLVLLSLGNRPGRGMALVLLGCWWAVLLPDGKQPLPGSFRITALDVGQGTAIVVDTHDHRLIYDTGAAYPSGFDLGDAVVVPSFRRSRKQTLSGLVLSHDDLDHTGGARSVVEQLRPERIWTSFPAPQFSGSSEHKLSRCTATAQWRWDDVTFRFLHPPERWRGSDNDSSCVLRISAGGRSALLGGDISKRVERMLQAEEVDLLFAPHHGSRTSSSQSFVNRLRPETVFISTDRRSRYGHPHPDVLARYQDARTFITGRQGALIWESSSPSEVEEWRADQGAYWHRWP